MELLLLKEVDKKYWIECRCVVLMQVCTCNVILRALKQPLMRIRWEVCTNGYTLEIAVGGSPINGCGHATQPGDSSAVLGRSDLSGLSNPSIPPGLCMGPDDTRIRQTSWLRPEGCTGRNFWAGARRGLSLSMSRSSSPPTIHQLIFSLSHQVHSPDSQLRRVKGKPWY